VIQRIQTIYLLLAALVSLGLPYAFSLYSDMDGEAVWAVDDISYITLFSLSAVFSFISIFLWNNRKNQFVLGRLNILLNFA
jgi:hypothetical protein